MEMPVAVAGWANHAGTFMSLIDSYKTKTEPRANDRPKGVDLYAPLKHLRTLGSLPYLGSNFRSSASTAHQNSCRECGKCSKYQLACTSLGNLQCENSGRPDRRCGRELFCDCTLACDRKLFRAHKMILAMSSQLFENIFLSTEDKNPVVILHEVEAWQVECLLNYMYKGETRVSDAHFIPLCRVAKSLQIKGFDKLELYREAVKQSQKGDSRLIAKADESSNESFISIRPPGVLMNHPSKDGSWNKHPGHNNSKSTSNDSSVVPEKDRQNTCTSINPAEHQSTSPSTACSTILREKETPCTSPNESISEKVSDCHSLLTQCQPSYHEVPKLHSSSPPSVPFSEKFNYRSSSTFNFKKNYLLSSSHTSPSVNQKPTTTTNSTTIITTNATPEEGPSTTKTKIEYQSQSHLVYLTPTSLSPSYSSSSPSLHFHSRDRQTEDGGHLPLVFQRAGDLKPSSATVNKSLRDPPPLLRIKTQLLLEHPCTLETSGTHYIDSASSWTRTTDSQAQFQPQIQREFVTYDRFPDHRHIKCERDSNLEQSDPHLPLNQGDDKHSLSLLPSAPTPPQLYPVSPHIYPPFECPPHRSRDSRTPINLVSPQGCTQVTGPDSNPGALPLTPTSNGCTTGSNTKQWLDSFLQMTLKSEPGSDPLLKKIPTNKRKRVRGPKSWEFLLRLLRSPESNPSLIRWENESAGVFRLIRPEVIALRWGRRTGKHVHDILSYESFSRGLRYHYATGALCAVSEKSFVYQFGPKAQEILRSSWDRPDAPTTQS